MWTTCDNINKYAAGASHLAGRPQIKRSHSANPGNVAALLFLLPWACTDSANGTLCGAVGVTVSCDNGSPPLVIPPTARPVPAGNLNTFFDGSKSPTGYAMGTIPAIGMVDCTFTLTAGTIRNRVGAISQQLGWILTSSVI